MSKLTFQWSLLLPLVLSLVVGAGAGIVATVTTSRTIDDYAAQLLDERKFAALAPRELSSLPGTYEESLKALRENSERTLGLFLPASKDSVTNSAWLTAIDAKGVGVVVSANGWVLTTSHVYSEAAAKAGVEVWVDHKRYVVERAVRDTETPLVLVKLVEATQLPTVGFADTAALQSGDMIFAFADGGASLDPLALQAADEEILFGALKAEAFATGWTLTEVINEGLPLFAASGDLAGFSLEDGRALPLHHSSNFVQDVVRGGTPHQTVLGAYVLDLAHAYNLTEDLRQGRYLGALVIAPSLSVRAVPKGSPAELAGLAPGDIILDVDGETITAQTSLSELLVLYNPGEIANLRVLRGGEVMTVPVTLADETNKVY